MEMYGNSRCVEYSEIVGNILSVPSYKKNVREGRIRVVRKGGNGRVALIDYASLPERIKRAYDAMFPTASNDVIQQEMKSVLKSDSKAMEYYRRYTNAAGNGLTDVMQAEYVKNAEVLNEMIRVDNEMTAMKKKMGGSRKGVWEAVVSVCEKLRAEYKHTLPVNESRLREKYNSYRKDGYKVLISGKVGNQNTRKIGPAEARLLIKLKRSRVPVYTDAQIYEEFNVQAEKRGFDQLKSATTVRNFLYEPSVLPLWWSAVYGEQSWKNKFSALLKTELPSLRDSLWYSDGTKLNLYYRDDKNVVRTTAVYEVMDAYSEVFVGYDIAPTECFDSQYRAFRMAVEFSGHKPYEIVNDNQGGHTKMSANGFLNNISHVQRRTAPYSGQSKTIESAFGRFQSQVMHQLWMFTGQNITAKKENSHINREFLEANVRNLPTLEEAKVLYKECRDKWNAGTHPKTGLSRMDMYMMSENPETPAVTEIDMVQMFWIKSKEAITYTNSGIKVTIDKQTYEYQVYMKDQPGVRDDSFALKNTGRKFHVLYDPYDMTMVELWEVTATGLRFATEATPKLSIFRNIQERDEDENIMMRAQIESNARTRALAHFTMEDFDINEMINPEYFGLSTPEPKGISKKRLDEYKTAYERGKITSPIAVPELVEVEDQGEAEPATLGAYTKAVSNMEEMYLNKWLNQ